jgi:hypothetical protein
VEELPGTHGSAVSFSPDGRFLAAADAYDASQCCGWRTAGGGQLRQRAQHRLLARRDPGGVADDDGLVRLHSFNPQD